MKTEFTVPIYNVSVTVYKTDDISEVTKDFEDLTEDVLGDGIAFCSEKNGDFVLIYTEDARIHSFSHEIFHLTCGIMEDKGIELCRESEEAFAYLNGYLYETIVEWFQENELKLL